jgi:hypothetical protein
LITIRIIVLFPVLVFILLILWETAADEAPDRYAHRRLRDYDQEYDQD